MAAPTLAAADLHNFRDDKDHMKTLSPRNFRSGTVTCNVV
jgi:hypothetical protein